MRYTAPNKALIHLAINLLKPRNLVIALTFLCFMINITAIASTDTTGTVSGRVTDKFTKEPIPGANMIVKGTIMGAATRMDGPYIVRNVPMGTYRLDCRMLGYRMATVEGVKVARESTTVVNFQLRCPYDPSIDIDTVDFGPDSLIDTAVCPVKVRIWAEKDTFLLGEKIYLGCEIKNVMPYPIFMVKPNYSFVVKDNIGRVMPRPKAGVCGNSFAYPPKITLLNPDETFNLYQGPILLNNWYKITQTGNYYISMHFKHNCKALPGRLRRLIERYVARHCDIWTDPIEITVLKRQCLASSILRSPFKSLDR